MVDFSEKVEAYKKACEDFLIEKHGTIRENWKPLIKMLTQQYEIYLISQEEIKNKGLLIQSQRGLYSNPAIKINTDALIQIQKLVSELHLSPRQEARLTEKKTNETIDAGNFIASLINQ